MSVGDAFDRAAQTYDAERPLLVPCFDAFYGAALDALATLPECGRVVDLGAGTGLFSGMLAARRPDLRFTLIDIAGNMLDHVPERFEAMGLDPPACIVADYAVATPPGPWDAAISALSIHHLEDEVKRGLYRALPGALAPGGVFVNADQVAGAYAAGEADMRERWEAGCRGAGATDNMIERARRRMRHDRCAPLEVQLEWLREAGFREVSVPFADPMFAVMVAR